MRDDHDCLPDGGLYVKSGIQAKILVPLLSLTALCSPHKALPAAHPNRLANQVSRQPLCPLTDAGSQIIVGADSLKCS